MWRKKRLLVVPCLTNSLLYLALILTFWIEGKATDENYSDDVFDDDPMDAVVEATVEN